MMQESNYDGFIRSLRVDSVLVATWLKRVEEVVDGGKEVSWEECFSCEYYDLKLVPIIDEQETCTHIITICRNITDKKKVDDFRSRLEKLDSIGVLAGGIAHDFNNILTVTMGNISLAKLKMSLLDVDNKNDIDIYLTEAEKGSKQAKKLIDQLLTFSKGGSPILKTCSIGDILHETATFILRGSNVNCQYNISKNLSWAEIDEGQISQVISNLVINAMQAMPTGGTIKIIAEDVSIEIGNPLSLKSGDYVKISLVDQGIGIPEKYISKIFDPYFTTKQKGSGLGLATSYSIINNHGGCITVDSEVGVGTIFTIYLKASDKTEDVTAAHQKENSLDVTNGRILIRAW